MQDAPDPCAVSEGCTVTAGTDLEEAAVATTCSLTPVDAAATPAVVGSCAVATGSGSCEYVAPVPSYKSKVVKCAEDEEDEWDEWGKKPKELVEAKRKQRRRSLQSDSQRLMGLGFEKSAREKLWAEEQKVIASNHARNERVARAEAKEQAEKMASLLDAKAPWTCDVCQKSMPRSKVSSCTFISLSSAVSVSLPLSLCHCVFLN